MISTTRRRRRKRQHIQSVISVSAEKRKAKPNSKRRQLEKQGQLLPNWSDLPRDIVELIIGRLRWVDRIRIRAVCKAWSIPNRHIPITNKFPWALQFLWRPTYNGQIYGTCWLVDPLSRDYVAEEGVKGKECQFFLHCIVCASVYGWVLFSVFEPGQKSLVLYSPFTTEVIKLPESGKPSKFQVVTFSLNSTSPKCVIFVLRMQSQKIYVNICSPGDLSWKGFEFSGFNWSNGAVDAAYANGVFYCVFSGGRLGAFNVELEEWTILADHTLPEFDFIGARLIASDVDLRLLGLSDSESLKLLKFDFSEMRWVYEKNLNNHVLFIGCTSFSTPAVGETSHLANTIFSCRSIHPTVRHYGTTSCSCERSLLYRKWIDAAKYSKTWIELPLGGIWRANDLINAV